MELKKYLKITLASIQNNSNLIFKVFFIVLVIFRLWLITGIPKMPIAGPHDDLYFAKAAHYIIHGQWMGPYSQMTLIKGPFYGLFLVVSFITGLPLLINETIFYIVACFVLFLAFIPLIRNKWIRLIIFTVLLFSPGSLTTYMNLRVYREFVYFSLTLYIVAFSIGFFLRVKRKISTLLPWSIGIGISMGAFLITREEGIWIFPVLILLFVVCITIIWKMKLDHKLWRTILVLLPIFIWYIPIVAVSYLNYSHYGFWGTSELLDPDFTRIINTLGRIETKSPWHPAIQISKEARMKAYEVSPILFDLKDSIEASVISWNIHDDNGMTSKPQWYLDKYGNGGTEIGNGHFPWLVRDIAATEGYYADGKFPKEFYKQIADQLEAACTNGKLTCSPSMNIPMVGSIEPRHYPIILHMFFDSTYHLLKLDYINIISLNILQWPNWPKDNDEYKYVNEFTNDSINVVVVNNPNEISQTIVNGNRDLRLKILPIKEEIMKKFFNFYQLLTFPVFLIALLSWILFFVLRFRNKSKVINGSLLIITTFIIGLLFSRLMTLTIVDATTSIPGISTYGASNLIFIHIFQTLITIYLIKQLHGIIRKQE